MNWVLELAMRAGSEFDVIGPGLAFYPKEGIAYIYVPAAMDAFRLSRRLPKGEGSIPYGPDEFTPVMLGMLDGLKAAGKTATAVCLELRRWKHSRQGEEGA